jgi:hypothetical protein
VSYCSLGTVRSYLGERRFREAAMAYRAKAGRWPPLPPAHRIRMLARRVGRTVLRSCCCCLGCGKLPAMPGSDRFPDTADGGDDGVGDDGDDADAAASADAPRAGESPKQQGAREKKAAQQALKAAKAAVKTAAAARKAARREVTVRSDALAEQRLDPFRRACDWDLHHLEIEHSKGADLAAAARREAAAEGLAEAQAWVTQMTGSPAGCPSSPPPPAAGGGGGGLAGRPVGMSTLAPVEPPEGRASPASPMSPVGM